MSSKEAHNDTDSARDLAKHKPKPPAPNVDGYQRTERTHSDSSMDAMLDRLRKSNKQYDSFQEMEPAEKKDGSNSYWEVKGC